jgi:hypothetical protein
MQQILEAMLRDFERAPIEALDHRPPKFDTDGQPVGPETAFSPWDLRAGRDVSGRDRFRKSLAMLDHGVLLRLGDILPGRAPCAEADRAELLVDRLEHRTLDAMQAADLTAAKLAESPWSDDYWALYLGVLGKRYADVRFPAGADWHENHDYIQRHPARDIVARENAAAIDLLSPSEKYDILVGDTSMGLTRRMWAEGKYYYDSTGDVESWMGICHGWAPASYCLPRPRHAVDVLAADGRTHLRFYPSDIKGLATLLWANADTVSRFVGGRCNDKDPATDASGRLVSERCFDTNPGTFHLAVVNQLGVCRRSAVMDATYDYEVWNQPLHAYRYALFNPQTRRYTPNLAAAQVSRTDYTRDHFRGRRAQAAAAFVGIMMELTYVVETAPTHALEDSPAQDRLRMARYLYDLELDGSGQIIGGEWYTNKHPDFLWTPPPNTRARTPADALVSGTWAAGTTVPEAWRRTAWRAADSASPSPLAAIVEALIARSRG